MVAKNYFLGQVVHYSRADIICMLKAKQSSESALYPMLHQTTECITYWIN